MAFFKDQRHRQAVGNEGMARLADPVQAGLPAKKVQGLFDRFPRTDAAGGATEELDEMMASQGFHAFSRQKSSTTSFSQE